MRELAGAMALVGACSCLAQFKLNHTCLYLIGSLCCRISVMYCHGAPST